MLKDEKKENEAMSETPTTSARKRNPVIASVEAYKPPDGLTVAQRIAHFLHWMGGRHPGTPVAPNLIWKAIMSLPRTPRLDSDESRMAACACSRARPIMKEQYKRSIVYERGLGYRATTSDEDTASTQLRADASRLVSAQRGLAATAAIINPAKIKNDELRSWVTKGVLPTLKALSHDERITKLLPQKDEE
jgi:hypothetical protein